MSEKSSNKLDKRRKSISDGPSSGRSVRSDPNTSGKKKPNRRDGSTKSKSEATIIKAGAKAELDIPISSSRPSTDSSSRRGSGKNNTVNNNQASERGSLKRKRSKNDLKKNNKAKYKPKQRQRTLNEKFMKWMGFSVGNITVSDPRAIEAVVALDLQPHHLRKLRKKFDKIDIDGSGNIDYDEFFESVGELRSPFTDKLFALIGKNSSFTILYPFLFPMILLLMVRVRTPF